MSKSQLLPVSGHVSSKDIPYDPETGEVILSGETAEYWAGVINEDIRKSVQSAIDAGLHLIEAKESLSHGEWGKLTGETAEDGKGLLSFSASTARRLMAIAKDPRLSNRAHAHDLPPSWYTLYELTKLTDEQWDFGLSQGVIRPDMERKEIRALRLSAKDFGEPEPMAGKYRVIYADPPWSYGNSGLDEYGHAERHYPSMSIDALCELPVKELAQDNAVLFMWVTSPLLEESFKVIKAWGFEYKSSFVWDKVKHNFGYYNSVRHEFLLVCTRGSCTPDIKELHDSVIQIERTQKHSEKPAYFRELIDRLYVKGDRIELFSRSPAEGWKAWGNEASQ